MRLFVVSSLLVGLSACDAKPDSDGEVAVCDGYPPGAVEPMAVGSVLFPYSWPVAHRLDGGESRALSLGLAPCDADPDITWNPYDLLVFVSLPAW